ncbi:hypothetical protein QA640_13180 [Bradyrhizobium sp. CB82]|uniref:hypothetical protein n=1 Tax=Bradyrhizobium sp. CB82 TaxID=3039159 RepID=UPI0024B15F0A|nr:hypothetical protein [Bradyrhizobium sp. CB82]WFU43314.1 hypothetical protein QA640_13180 [Bradyrhizobium sp. CB82]
MLDDLTDSLKSFEIILPVVVVLLEVERAITKATKPRDPDNPNRLPQGNALAAICAEYLGRKAAK